MDRERLLLQLLHTVCGSNGSLTNTDFQGLLFLFVKKYAKDETAYEFVPHRFGPFSYTCFQDKWKLMKRGQLKKNQKYWQLTRFGAKLVERYPEQLPAMGLFRDGYGKLRGERLMIEHYCQYPFYATRSEILEQVLPNLYYRQRVIRARAPRIKGGVLTFYLEFYLERFLNQLLQNSVNLIVKLQPNPCGAEGVATKTLMKACKDLDIRYEHLPDLDYAEYCSEQWPNRTIWMDAYEQRIKSSPGLSTIRTWLNEGHRLALVDVEYSGNNHDSPRFRAAKLLIPDQAKSETIYYSFKLNRPGSPVN